MTALNVAHELLKVRVAGNVDLGGLKRRIQDMQSTIDAALADAANDDAGLPFVTHLPLHLEEREGKFFLLGHCARLHPHWRFLQERPTALVTFLGPHAYQSPSIYPDLARVPSWNYLAVHCTVVVPSADVKVYLVADRDDRREQRQHGPQPEADEALRNHPSRIA